MRALIVLLALVLLSGTSFAQDRKKQNMTRENRERMREDMREVHRDKFGGGRPERQRQMTSQEREKLRQDIREANKNLKR